MLIEIKVEDYRGKNILAVANNIKGRKDTSANSKGEFYEKISSYILVCRRIYQQLETFTSLSNAEKV